MLPFALPVDMSYIDAIDVLPFTVPGDDVSPFALPVDDMLPFTLPVDMACIDAIDVI